MKKVAVITGGSEGVGFALASLFAKKEFDIILLARDSAKLMGAADRLVSEFGVVVKTISCDVSEDESVARAITEIGGIAPHVDVLVNSAGTFRWDPSDINLMAVNAESKSRMMEGALLLLNAGSWIINVSSQAALFREDDPRRVGEEEYVQSMARVDELSAAFAAAHPEINVYVTHPPLMKGKIAEEQFRGRPGFEDIDFDALPGPEIVAEEIERVVFGDSAV